MTWAKIDDKFPRHRRIRELRGDTDAKWLHVTAICFCSEHLTDGKIDDVDLPALIHDSEMSAAKAKRSINNLLKVGLWERNEDGSYVIRDFLDYNPSSAEVKDLRATRSEAGRLGGVNSGESRRSKSEATASIVDEALASVRLEPQGLEPPAQSPAQSPKNKIKSSGLLDNGRSVACQDLLRLVQGGDNGTPRVVERFCKQLPRERIDRVASTLRVGVKPAIAVAALKREVLAYEAEVQAEGAA